MINVPSEAPENMEKALKEAADLIGSQLNEIADKYKVMIDVTAYRDEGDEYGKRVHIAVTDRVRIVSVFRYLTGEHAKDTEEASVTWRK